MTLNRDIVGEIHNYGVDVKNREIYINEFDDSGESAGVDHRMLQMFIKNMNILKNQLRPNNNTYANRWRLLVLWYGYI